MAVIRGVEKAAYDLFMTGLVKGTTHLASGHEAVAVGASAALRPDDYVFATYRGHHHAMARGATPAECLAELMSKATGACKAKGGSMHLTRADHGMLGSYAIVGAHLPMAVGAAWSAKLRGTGQVAVAFFGDGATNIGAFHEALNLAAVWKLPVLFVCENNLYMEYTPIASVTVGAATRRPTGRAANGMPGAHRRRQRRGRGPATRWPRPSQRARAGDGPDRHRGADLPALRAQPRRPGEVPPGRRRSRSGCARDPLDRRAQPAAPTLGVADDDVDDAADARRSGPSPRRSRRRRPRRTPTRRRRSPTSGRTEVRHGGTERHRDHLPRRGRRGHRPRDARATRPWSASARTSAPPAGVFKTTVGLFEEFGPSGSGTRPISEQAIVGAAMGAAMTGHAAGRRDHVLRLPRLLLGLPRQRDPEGALHDRRPGHGAARRSAPRTAAASASAPSTRRPWRTGSFTVPGLKIVAPSTPADVVGLMASAIRSDDPVVFFEHKGLFASKGEPAPPDHVVPLGRGARSPARAPTSPSSRWPRRCRSRWRPPSSWPARASPPRSSTCAAWSRSTCQPCSSRVRAHLAGWSSSRRTRTRAAGAARSSSIVADEGFELLDAPIRRVAAECVPLPFADALEDEVIPTVAKVVDAVRRLAAY